MGLMICLGQGGLCSRSASSSLHSLFIHRSCLSFCFLCFIFLAFLLTLSTSQHSKSYKRERERDVERERADSVADNRVLLSFQQQ